MLQTEVLVEGYRRIGDAVHQVLRRIPPEALTWRADGDANTIAWLVWHLTRVQDDHIADASGRDQVWHDDGWCERFDLPLERSDTGYGHDPNEVAFVHPTPDLLAGYYDAVADRSGAYLRSLGDDDLDRVVDDSWSPPVTLGVRLVSVLSDDLQHAGQAAFLRGMAERA